MRKERKVLKIITNFLIRYYFICALSVPKFCGFFYIKLFFFVSFAPLRWTVFNSLNLILWFFGDIDQCIYDWDGNCTTAFSADVYYVRNLNILFIIKEYL